MYNHFRTLLLNLTNVGNPDEHIPFGWVSKILPTKLTYIYKILYPDITSRYYKMFLTQNYINIVKAAGREQDLLTHDTRIVDNDDAEFFKINRYSNPNISNSNNPIFVYGQYNLVNRNQYFYDDFTIAQQGADSSVTIYSNINNFYINGNDISSVVDPSFVIPLTFDNGLSNVVSIGNTGISFAVGGTDFNSTTNKSWQFLVEAPYVFDFNTIFSNLKKIDAGNLVKSFNPTVDVSTYLNLWNQHPNNVYKMAGLLLAYVEKINSI